MIDKYWNPQERCPRPLYSRDSTQEGHTIPHHHHQVDPSSYRNPPERCPRPLYSRDSTQEGHTIPHHHQVDDDNYWNPPERCPRPLYSRDSTQEGHTIPHHHKGKDLIDIKVEVKEEEEEAYVRDDQQSMEEDGITGTFIEEDTPTEISTAAPHITGWIQSWEPTREMSPSSVFPGFPTGRSHHPSPSQVDESSHGNPPERCPRPLYSRDSTQEGHTIPHHHQGEDLMKMKVEGEVEETYVRDDQQYTEEAGMMRTFKEEDTPTEISTGETQYILLLSLLCYCTLI
ncbi:unnamed protein product, partial [Staurois parvus]